MEVPKINLTEDGPTISTILQGFWRLTDWNFSKTELQEFITDLVDLGINTFDHADIYGNYLCEELFGNAFKDIDIKREDVKIITKCGIKLVSEKRPNHKIKSYDTSKLHIISSVENSLNKLQTDYIDILLIHRPDPLMNADEVAEAFYKLKNDGKALFFGVSNFEISQLELLQSRLDFPLVTNQIEYSVLNTLVQSNGTLDYCQQHKIIPMAWSPFGGGDLFMGNNEQIKKVRHSLQIISNKIGNYSIDQIALAWLLKHPANIVPVIGTGKIKRIKSAIKSLKINLTREDWFEILKASSGFDVP